MSGDLDERVPAENSRGNTARGVGGAWIVVVAMAALVVLGIVAYLARHQGASPPPPAVAANPGTADDPGSAGDPGIVDAGREIYRARCASCHGPAGKGDGPIARGLPGPAPRDLTAGQWKHGDRPEDVLEVVSRGVKDTAMAGWGGMLGPEGTKAVTAYIYQLAGRPVPAMLRTP